MPAARRFPGSLLAVWLATALLAFGDWDDDISAGATEVPWDFARWCDVGAHHFVLEKTTLHDIVTAFGAGMIERDGAPGAAVYEWLVRYRHGDEIVTFFSNNDMGGPDHLLEEVEVRPFDGEVRETRYPRIRGLLLTPFGGFELSLSSLESRLGKAKVIDTDLVKYEYVGKSKGLYGGKVVDYDVSGWLQGRMTNGQIHTWAFGHITSY